MATVPEQSQQGHPISTVVRFVSTHYKKAATWNNLVFSLSVLIGVNVTFLLYWGLDLTMTSLMLYSAAAFVGMGFFYTRFYNSNLTPSSSVEIVSKDKMEKTVDYFYDQINNLAASVRALFCWEVKHRSAAALCCLVAAAWLSTKLSTSFMIYLVMNGALVHVPIAKMYKEHAAPIVQPYFCEMSASVRSIIDRIPRLNEATIDSKSKKI